MKCLPGKPRRLYREDMRSAINDMNFHNSKSFRLAQDFATYLIDSFNWLWDEGLHTPRMMS
ncbi:MAG: hypothetical protein Kow00121_32900 [Elainellaceae cyanobacterium]